MITVTEQRTTVVVQNTQAVVVAPTFEQVVIQITTPPDGLSLFKPPGGSYNITAMYVTTDGKLHVEYDDGI